MRHAVLRNSRIGKEACRLPIGCRRESREFFDGFTISVLRRSRLILVLTNQHCLELALALASLEPQEEVEIRVVRKISHLQGACRHGFAFFQANLVS